MTNDMNIELELNLKEIEKDILEYFGKKIKNAFTKSVEYMFGVMYKNAPGVLIRVGLRYEAEVDSKGVTAFGFIGFPVKSEVETIAKWTEFGTGERGFKSFVRYFDEEKPKYTIPIRPLRAKALHWVSKGEDVFAKTTKGQRGQAWMRLSVKNSLPDIDRIWEKEFSTP